MKKIKKRNLAQRITSRLARDFSLPILLEQPRFIHVVPTNACNLRCRACPKTAYKTDTRHMSPEVYRRIRDGAMPHAQTVSLLGLGEPFLSPIFTEMIEDAIRFDLVIQFVTNASRITPDHIPLLVRANANFAISLDGATAETHEYSRVGSSFSEILEVLEHLKEARRNSPGSQMRLFFSTVVTRMNIAEVPDILRLAHRYGVEGINLVTPGMDGRQDDYAQATIGFHHDLYRSHLDAIGQAEAETGVHVQLPPYILHSPVDTPEGEVRSLPAAKRVFPQKCYAPFFETYFDVDGSVHPCCRAPWIIMGNVLNDSPRSIWNGRHYRLLRRTVNSNCPPDFCRTCTMASGITAGEERYLERLYAQGFPRLPEGPNIGLKANHPG